MVLNIYFNISDYVFYILWVDGGANMDIAIIDDEQVFLEIFKSDVIKICNDNDIECYIDTFNSARNIMEIYKNYHLIFLDIDMPGTDGITALRAVEVAGEILISQHLQDKLHALQNLVCPERVWRFLLN